MKFFLNLLPVLMIAGATSAQAQQTTLAQAAAKIDPALVKFARGESNQKVNSIFIVLENLNKGQRLPQRYHHAQVVTFLRDAAVGTKRAYDEYLSKIPNLRDNMRPHKFYVSTLTYSAVVTPQGLKIAAMGPGVVKIYANRRIQRDPSSRPVEMRPIREGNFPYDLVDVSLDKARQEFPQVNGAGVILGSVDTGVDATHGALKGKIRLFYDGDKHSTGTPHDTDSHGTHTIGTMIGDGQGGAPMGMAPKAQMIAAAALSGYDVMLESMDFMLDPDKNPQTADYPRAVNNSWHAGGAPDMELFYRAINSWEAAGILPVFSAGNAGPGDGTITHPKEHPAAFAVAATGENGKATNFSSRGPAVFNGKKTEKPDIAAPGNNIVSSVPGGSFASMSGTSMAAPHVTGATALLFQIDPKLTPVQIRAVLQKSTNPVDEKGSPAGNRVWNKVYGLGKLNIHAAIKLAMNVAHRRGGMMEIMESFFVSPETMSINDILGLEEPETINPFAYPADLEGEGWASVKDLY